jgi:hypothetical protein
MRRNTLIGAGAVLRSRAAHHGIHPSAETYAHSFTVGSRTGLFQLSLAETSSTSAPEALSRHACQLEPRRDALSYEIYIPDRHGPDRFWYRPRPTGFLDLPTHEDMSAALVVAGCWIRLCSPVRCGSRRER